MPESLPIKSARDDYAVIGVFIGIIFGLFAMSLPRLSQTGSVYSLDEKRKLAALPELRSNFRSFKTFPTGFEKFLNDRFAYRKQLVTADSWIKYNGFNVSTSHNVVIGNDGWLFLADSDDYSTMRHSPIFAPEELHEMGRALEARRRWLAKRGIKYLVVVAPSKCTIYPEHIPAAQAPVQKLSRCDQFYEELKEHTHVRAVDLRPTLLAAKSTIKIQPIYFKTDTHWNFAGAMIGTEKMVESIRDWFPNLDTIALSQTRPSQAILEDGDLAGMLGLDHLMNEDETVLIPHQHFSWRMSKDMPANFDDPSATYKPFATENDDQTLPRAVVFRDSFFQIGRFYVSEHFSRATYYWLFKSFPTDVIAREKPDIVIQEIVERFLASQMPINSPDVDASYTRGELAENLHQSQLAGLGRAPTN